MGRAIILVGKGVGGEAGGNVVGPTSATNNALVRWDTTTGKLIKDSNVTLADSGTALVFSGAAGLTSSGSNNSITLTPSGTGSVLAGPSSVTSQVFIGAQSDATTYGVISFNGVSSSTGRLGFSGGGGGDTNLYQNVATTGTFRWLVSNTEKMRLATSGNLLLGGLTTDGTGLLQLATGTTSASGITLGADFNFYRYGAGQVAMDSAGNTGFALRTGGVEKLFLGVVANDAIVVAASNLFLRSGGNVAALTLDSSQNATFAGAIIGGIQALSGAGAVNVTQLTTAYTSTGGAQALTLANGSNGQIKTITHVVDGGSGVLTPTTKTGYTTITFTNAGDAVTLQYFTTQGWLIVGIFGAIAA